MNLTRHIIKKDLHRLWIPLAVWGVMLVADTLSKALIITGAREYGLGGIVAGFAPIIDWVLTFVLAGKFVVEDPPTGTGVFWRTRPISRGQLLRAKATELGALILIPVAFYLCLLALSGIGGREAVSATADAVLWRAVVVVSAGALAAVSESFGGFVVRAFAVILGSAFLASLVGGIVHASRMMSQTVPATSLAESGVLIAKILALIVAGGLLAWRYYTHHQRWAVTGIYVGALLVMVTPSLWPWDFLGQIRFGKSISADSQIVGLSLSSPQLWATPAGAGLRHIMGRIEVPLLANGEILVPQRTDRVKIVDRQQQPVHTRFFMKYVSQSRSPASLEPAALASCLAPLKLLATPTKQPVSTELFSLMELPTSDQQPLSLEAQLTATRTRFMIEAELPAHAGAAVHRGRLHLQIDDVLVEDNKVTMRLREREFRPGMIGETSTRTFPNPLQPGTVPWELSNRSDSLYVLANRPRGEAILVDDSTSWSLSSIGDIRNSHGSFAVAIPPTWKALSPKWLEVATLIRVRLVDLEPVSCSLQGSGLTIKE